MARGFWRAHVGWLFEPWNRDLERYIADLDGDQLKRPASRIIKLRGEIPLNTAIRIHGDEGHPEEIFTNTSDYVREAVERVVTNAAGRISVQSQRQVAAPTLSIES